MKIRTLIVILFSAMLVAGAYSGLEAAKAKAPAKASKTTKPAKSTKPAKPAVKPKARPMAAKGTKQWDGENAGIDETFTIDGSMNFTLKSLEYSTGPFCVGKDEGATTITSGPKNKFLILYFTLKNPLPEEQGVNWATVHFTVVDNNNSNFEGTDYIGQQKDLDKLGIRLKPGQPVDCYSAVLMPADTVVAKIIVRGSQPEKGVLRYFKEKLKIKGIPAPYADPKDPTGATALDVLPAEKGQFYNLRTNAYRVDSLEYTSEPVAGRELEEDMRYFVATVTIKNIGCDEQSLGWGESSGTMLVTDQDEQISNWDYLLPKANRAAEYIKMKPGQERTVRFAFPMNNSSNAQTLVLCNGEDSRTMTLDVSDVR